MIRPQNYEKYPSIALYTGHNSLKSAKFFTFSLFFVCFLICLPYICRKKMRQII